MKNCTLHVVSGPRSGRKTSSIHINFLEKSFSRTRSARPGSAAAAASAAASTSAAGSRGRCPVLDALDVAPPLAQVLRPRLCPLDVEVDFPPLRVKRVDLGLEFRQHFGVGLQGALQGLQV